MPIDETPFDADSVWTPWAPAWNLSRTLNLAAAFDTATLRRRLGSNAESTPTAASRRFMARIGADDAATAEAELGRHIRQSDFDKVDRRSSLEQARFPFNETLSFMDN